MTEKEKALAGKMYDCMDPELVKERAKSHALCREYNQIPEEEEEKRQAILKKLLGGIGEETYLQGPILIDYGSNVYFGKRCFANFNLTILDTCQVHIGNDVFIGPNCGIYTPLHPLLSVERKLYWDKNEGETDKEYGAPITIEDGCWLAGHVTVCPGVTIGARTVVGAGSVVTHSLPPDSLCAGVPCRVLRPLTSEDSLENRPELFADGDKWNS